MRKMEKHTTPFLQILIPFCVGIWILRDVPIAKLNLLLFISLILIFILKFIIRYLYKSIKVYHHKRKLTFLICLFFFLLGGQRVLNHDERVNSDHFSKRAANFLRIVTDNEPRQKGNMLTFRARVNMVYHAGKRYPSTGTLLVTLQLPKSPFVNPEYGEVFLIPAKFHMVNDVRNPGEFDYRAWLSNQNIYHQTYLRTAEIRPAGKPEGNPIISFALKLRQTQISHYRKLILNDEAFAVASTLILGYRADLSEETLSAYSKTGTIHALSVSGMHVGIIYLILEWALRRMNRNAGWKWIKNTLILVLISAYALLTGYSPSVLRSAIMLSVFILSKATGKHAGSDHVLSLSAFCLLFWNPYLWWDAGFQLSYIAVCGLVYIQPRLEGLLKFRSGIFRKVWSLICISLSAQLVTFPFSIYYFHQFPVYFLLSNLLITLPVSLLMYAGIGILIFPLDWLSRPFEQLILLMNWLLEKIAHLPCSVITPIWISKTELWLLCLSLVFLLAGLSAKKKHYFFILLPLLIILQSLRTRDRMLAGSQKKTIIFNLSKNYATAFICGTSAMIITDLRTADKTFIFHIQPALDQLRIRHLRLIHLHRISQTKQENARKSTIDFNEMPIFHL